MFYSLKIYLTLLHFDDYLLKSVDLTSKIDFTDVTTSFSMKELNKLGNYP
jgi:hypothetical protein